MLGFLAQSMGILNRASANFEDALAFYRKAGYHPEFAWACCGYADTLRERNNEGGQAISLLYESLAISNELGMRPIITLGAVPPELQRR